jgi:6-phosphogluconolactonase (cycloisomerase 2 family)
MSDRSARVGAGLSRRDFLGLGAGAAAGLLSLGGPGRRAWADDDDGRFVYTQSNDPAGNAVFAFRRHPDGRLTPVPGSPFPTGGTGITPTLNLGPFDSDQEILVDRHRRLLFTVNGGSDSIAVFRIDRDGSLDPIDGSPFDSGGSNPVSVGLAGDILCVVNKAEDPGHMADVLPNYTTFRVGHRGRLTPVPNSTLSVDIGSSPSQALVSPNRKLLFGADFLGGTLRSFHIRPDGRLVEADAQGLPDSIFAGTGAPPLPLGLAVHPEERLLYVDFVTVSKIGVYRYHHDGRLEFLRAIQDSGAGPCWIVVNRDGTRAYAGNTGDTSVTVYDIDEDPTTPVEIQHVTLKGPGNVFQLGLDPENRFLFAITQPASAGAPATANALHVLKIDGDGKLAEVETSPTVLPVMTMGTRSQGVASI